MQTFHSLDEITETGAAVRRSIVTIGSFDGVHLAHQELLRRVRERARNESASSVAITFDPHPLFILAPSRAPRLLTPLPMKLELLAQSDIDRLLILPFTEELSRWSPEQFAEQVLVNALRTSGVVVGDNFRFGHKQAGTPRLLEDLGQRWNFSTEVFPSIRIRGLTVSSSQVRAALEAGQISIANRLLGRPFAVRGEIVSGRGIGRSQTVPTLNLGPYTGLIPARGVYVTEVRLGVGGEDTPLGSSLARRLRSVTNVGVRPTFGERELGVETHLLDPWEGPVPPWMEILFLYRLRDERKFESAEQLKSQILRDARRAEAYFRRRERFCADVAAGS
jgi:riboflavin kinase/FMN adenylyltransferase